MASSLSSSHTATYGHSGQALIALRSEPARRINTADATGFDPSPATVQPVDTVSLSAAGLDLSRQANGGDSGRQPTGQDSAVDAARDKASAADPASQELTSEELAMIEELQARDQEVKTHEMAHLVSAGQYARGGPSYTYQRGPDGKRYAVGGEVPIDVGKENTPEETLQKMRIVKQAALAPASPSAADRQIAAAAAAQESQALMELQAERWNAEQEESGDHNVSSDKGQTNESSPKETATAQTLVHRHRPLSIFA